jgi:putative oxidoreductase
MAVNSNDGDRARTAREATHNLLRIMAGFAFAQHGAAKLFGVLGGVGPSGGPVELMSIMGLAGVIEFFGGILILVGLLTRPVAFLASGEMAFAYFMSHFPRGFLSLENRGEPALLFCFIFLFFAAHGAGSFSIDALFARRRSRVTAPTTA